MSERIEAAEAILATVNAARARIQHLAHAHLPFSRALALELRSTVGASSERLSLELTGELLERRLAVWRAARSGPDAAPSPLPLEVMTALLPVGAPTPTTPPPPVIVTTPSPVSHDPEDEAVDDEATPVAYEMSPSAEPMVLPPLFASAQDGDDDADERTAESLGEEVTYEGTRESAPAPVDLVRITAPRQDLVELAPLASQTAELSSPEPVTVEPITVEPVTVEPASFEQDIDEPLLVAPEDAAADHAAPEQASRDGSELVRFHEPELVRFHEPELVRFSEPSPPRNRAHRRPYEEPSGPVTVEPGELVYIAESDGADLVRFSEPAGTTPAPQLADDAGVENVFDELDDELLQEALADALGEEPSEHGGASVTRMLQPVDDEDDLDDDTDDLSGDRPTDIGELRPALEAEPPPRTTPPALQFIQPTTSIDDEPTFFAGPRQIQPRPIIDEEPVRRTATVQIGAARTRAAESTTDLEAAPDEESFPGAQHSGGFSVVLERPTQADDDDDSVEDEESAPAAATGPRLTDEEDLHDSLRTQPAAPEAARPDPTLVGDFLRKAQEALERADLNNAILYFRDLLDVDPDSVDGFLGRGRCLVELGDYAAAMSDFQRAEDLAPKSPEPLVEMGNLFFARKEYRRAIEFYDQAVEMDRNHAMAHCRRGICQHYRKNYDAAIKDLQRAQRLDPNIPNITKYVKMAVKASMTRPR